MLPRLTLEPRMDRYPPTRAPSEASPDPRDREIAELTAANKELELFVHTLAHDLRSPIHGIHGWAQAIEEDCAALLPPVGQQHLRQLSEQAKRLSDVVDGLFQLIQIGKAPVHLEPVDISALATELHRQFAKVHTDRDIELVLAENLEIQADAALTRLILQHLLDNAWKFTRRRQVARIEIGCLDESGATAVYVKDNGAGYAASRAHKLFLPFQRLHRQSDFPGLGLGLAMAAKAAKRQGGLIWSESVENEGATFYFSL